MEAIAPPPANKVLCVDMDGTLLATDVLWESLLVLLKRRPLSLLCLPAWLLRGKAYLKHQIAQRVMLDPASLPYRDDVLDLLRKEKEAGREIVLATASDRKLAEAVGGYLGLFSAVLASDGKVNLAGLQKLKALEVYVGGKEFTYLGNGKADIPLWMAASEATVVDPSARLLKQAQKVGAGLRIMSPRANRLRSLLQALRISQWVKNMLLFVPLLLAHKVTGGAQAVSALLAFCSFSICASGVYIVNDLLDLESDRRHPTRRFRAFAAGALPISTGVLLAPLLLGSSVLTAVLFLPHLFTTALGLYVVMTTAYTFYLKRIAVLDILVLAGFYTIRVVAGAMAVEVPVSPWLLAFSMFLFLSLALAKRYSELVLMHANGETLARGRGYLVDDKELLQSIGVTSGYLSVLVLALYINSKEVTALYQHPQALWLVCPCLLYWITRVWFFVYRGAIQEDPLVFTLKDPASYVVGGFVGLLILTAL
ncbi:Decaprenyl-phosphate phosphoribosyltransferase [Candidatus Methylomirabilis lanthanidiphila]|uniref:Decaprenyl-phosphate phosphoribosyltransferase n=1 Tax=Candidatus Methylomirabilis lanthanidiphila TaxID=2211376 RepID=A0A564ZN92_9BACT|nr:UbiA family prenyltransferase [Candidatus Methylomirabilis lanthanidiphila]VUZ86018.1 Decaprenyl-phosphate phosphoribosyltransferase [Candidatus Methylomirabilis lanthanidiphila]